MCFPPSRVEPTNEIPEIYCVQNNIRQVYLKHIIVVQYISHETYIGIYFEERAYTSLHASYF
jgi:hypothetical protein